MVIIRGLALALGLLLSGGGVVVKTVRDRSLRYAHAAPVAVPYSRTRDTQPRGPRPAIYQAVSQCLHALSRLLHGGGQGIVHKGPHRSVHAFVDTLLGVVVVVGAGLIIPGQWGLLHLEPHPLWFVALAVAVRYGAPAGYVAGGLAGVSYGLLVWLRPDARFQPLGAYDLLQSFLLYAGGVLVSEAVRALHQRLISMEEKYQKATKTLQEVTQRYQATLEVKAELERQIIDQPTSIATLYAVAKKLTTLQFGELYPAILDVVVNFLGAEACALYLQGARQLRLRAGRPAIWPDRPMVCGPETDLIGQALRERRVVTIRDRVLALGSPPVAREAVLMAGPLLDVGGHVAGVVVVERLPYLRLTPANAQLFDLILDWASTALHHATLYEQRRDRNVGEESNGAVTVAHTQRLVQSKSLPARRYHLPVQEDNVPRPTLARVVVGCQPPLQAVSMNGHRPEANKITHPDADAVRRCAGRGPDDQRSGVPGPNQ